jgi:hypothetical protein
MLSPSEQLSFQRALEHYYYDTVYHAQVTLVGLLCERVGQLRRRVAAQ